MASGMLGVLAAFLPVRGLAWGRSGLTAAVEERLEVVEVLQVVEGEVNTRPVLPPPAAPLTPSGSEPASFRSNFPSAPIL